MNHQSSLAFNKLLCVLFVLLCCTGPAISQQVSCAQTFDSVQRYVEKNYVGFADKVNAARTAYEAHTRQARAYAAKAQSPSDYYFVINYWLRFFKDHHMYMETPADTAHIETVSLPNNIVAQLNNSKTSGIEGIYYTLDSTYKVAVVKNKKGLRTYAGVILESQTPLWKPGQVKFELIPTGAHQYAGSWYLRNHSMYMADITWTAQQGLADQGWYKKGAPATTGTAPANSLFAEEQRHNAYFKKLNDSTGYLRIQSFNLNQAKTIDSVVRANLNNIQSMPKLVIDLRYNGGGSDHSMSYLKPILYTGPVKNIGVDLLTTPDNITAWEAIINKYRNALPQSYLDSLLQRIYQGKNQPRAFVNFTADDTESLPDVWPNPAKVAIVINYGCGSTTEEFLLYARQSKKVVIAGEHSQGVLDYSNVVFKDFYCPPFTLHYPTTRSRRIDAGQAIDNIGITPNIPLDLGKADWLQQLLKKW